MKAQPQGAAGSARRRGFRRVAMAAAGSVALVGGLYAASTASAAYTSIQQNGVFELDGNAVHNTLDDWDNVCHQVRNGSFPSPFTSTMGCVTAGNTSGATAVEWQSDGAALDGSNYNASIFTGGGSKDPIDTSSWGWKNDAGGLPDKDNLLHSFAARYGSDSQDLLFFGSDRYDNSGDAVQGYWFFQNEISLVGTNSGTFSGVHKDGDLLVLSDFSNGGTTATISVFAWDSTCAKGVTKPAVGDCADSNLRLKGTSSSANCSNTTTALNFCGIVNSQNGTTAPWPYKDKSGNSSYLNGEFFEGGINLTALGLSGKCFASAASETRSSTSTTAVLKDFVLGQFQVCGAGLKTTPSANSLVLGGSLTDTAAVTVTGGSSPPAPTGTVTFYVCGPSSGISSCDATTGTQFDTKNLSGATKVGNTYSVTSASYTPSAAGDYCFFATWPGDTNYTGGPYFDGSATECFTVTQLQPTMDTAQYYYPQDSATVNVATGAGDLKGYVQFRAFTNNTCTGTPAYDSGAIDKTTNTGESLTANTNNQTDFKVTTTTSVWWKVTFTSANTGIKNVTSNCTETSTVTINNGSTANTP